MHFATADHGRSNALRHQTRTLGRTAPHRHRPRPHRGRALRPPRPGVRCPVFALSVPPSRGGAGEVRRDAGEVGIACRKSGNVLRDRTRIVFSSHRAAVARPPVTVRPAAAVAPGVTFPAPGDPADRAEPPKAFHPPGRRAHRRRTRGRPRPARSGVPSTGSCRRARSRSSARRCDRVRRGGESRSRSAGRRAPPWRHRRAACVVPVRRNHHHRTRSSGAPARRVSAQRRKAAPKARRCCARSRDAVSWPAGVFGQREVSPGRHAPGQQGAHIRESGLRRSAGREVRAAGHAKGSPFAWPARRWASRTHPGSSGSGGVPAR